ncbi:MAG: hypothetical protein JO130_07095 [Solirubrobacterales bacterium]|nr:hypothetical protein [Solirubrobacterales bacterium]
MSNQQPPRRHLLDADEAAAATHLDVRIVWDYAAQELITPSSEGYDEAELAELRRVRRLREDLGLDHPAIAIILRMRRRIRTLQAEIRRLELAARSARSSRRQASWVEAEWNDQV